MLAEADPAGNADDMNSRDIGRRVEENEWQQHALAPLVEADALESLRTKMGAGFKRMSISEVGRALGAEQVLYVNVKDARIELTGDMIRGNAKVFAKIVDVKTGEALWPAASTVGQQVDSQSEYMTRGDGIHESNVMDQTRQTIAEDLVRLFYKFSPEKS